MSIELGNQDQPSDYSSSVGDSQKGIRYTKDYNIIALNLLSGYSPSIELKPVMVELSYFEDIYSNFVSGQILITDALGIIEKMGIHGNEYIRVAFAKDGSELQIDKLFRVYKVSMRQKLPGLDVEGYVLHFCSDELLVSEQYKISKSYSGKKVSEIVKDVLTTYLKAPSYKIKASNIEDTKGVYSLIVPNFKPFEAINWVSIYAQSAAPKTSGCDMLFFENAEGYNFVSLQSLFSKKPYYNYQYRPKNVNIESHNNDANKQIFNVLNYDILNSFNVVEGVSSGMFANRLLTIDPLLRRYNTTDFNYMNYQKSATKLNSNAIVNNLENRFGDTLYETPAGCFKVSGTNKDQAKVDYIASKQDGITKDIFAENVFSQRKSQISLANYTRVKLYISGDPSVTVGMTINFDVLSLDPASATHNKGLDQYYSGKYLITAVRHIIQTGGYNTIIEAVKDSIPEAYTLIDNNKPIWKNTVAGVLK